MPTLAERPLLAILAAGLIGLALGYASEAAAETAVSGGSVKVRHSGRGDIGLGAGRDVGGDNYRLGREGMRSVRGTGFGDGARRFDRRGYRDLEAPRSLYEADGSITYVRSHRRLANAGRDDTIENGYYGPSFEIFDEAYASDAALPGSFPSDARFIDIATERLDSRPLGPNGIDVIHTGGAKIIRIGNDGLRRAVRRSAAQRIDAGYLQPWSSGWLTHCMAAYASFDPALGTYVARDGRVRFCEAD